MRASLGRTNRAAEWAPARFPPKRTFSRARRATFPEGPGDTTPGLLAGMPRGVDNRSNHLYGRKRLHRGKPRPAQGDRQHLRLQIRHATRKRSGRSQSNTPEVSPAPLEQAVASGAPFELDVTTPGTYLHHRSELGEFFLSSDTVIPSFSRARELKHIIDQIPEVETEAFKRIGYTIGGMMVFPGNRVDGKMTINGARGFHGSIRDRFDLTLECIRRHYLGEPSPLSETLARYADFFGLFGDFAGYVDFFHLQDLVNEGTPTVKFSMPFENFTASPLPGTLDAYSEYRERAMEFIESRNRRIGAHVGSRPLMNSPA